MADGSFWWQADRNDVHTRVFDTVSSIESGQSDLFDRFLKLAVLYDPYDRQGYRGGWWQSGNAPWSGPDASVSENVCASNVDTVSAIISKNQPLPRFMTDDADWSEQRRAQNLEWYAQGLVKLLKVHKLAQRGFKDAAIKGTGLVKVFAKDPNKIVVERVMVDEIIVDEGECISGPPRQIHQRRFVDRELLKAEFPKFADEIDKAQRNSGTLGSWRWWADYRPIQSNQVVVIESWRLPIGEPDDDGFQPGRHTWCIDGKTLLDEEWEKPFFPFARFVWSERITGWYGIGLVERIAGTQRAINRMNWQIDRQLQQIAVPTTWVQMADANLAVKSTNQFGTIGVYKAAKPETIIPNAVSGEVYQRLERLGAKAYEESGVSRLSATSMKPAGLDSGEALREYKDSTTERFAPQEQGYEQFVMDIVLLVIDAAKDLGDDAPVISKRVRRGSRKIKWADVDMGEVSVQIAPASSLAKTPAGRIQQVLEWAQAGVITTDDARRLSEHPDLESAMSLYTAAQEDIDRCIEEVLEGNILVPEPYQNLKMGVWRFQMALLRANADGAPDEILENLRQWINQAAHVISEPPPPQGMAEQMPPPQMAPPMEAPPQAAFAPQAMQVMPH